MQFTVDAKALRTLLKNIKPAIPSKTTLYALQHVHIEAADNFILVRGTNLETTITGNVTAEVAEPGAALIPYKQLVNTLPTKGAVTFKVDGADVPVTLRKARLSANGGSIVLDTMSLEEYPVAPDMQLTHRAQVSGATLAKVAASIVPQALTDDSRPVLAGVYMALEEGGIRYSAADGYTMATMSEPAVWQDSEKWHAIIPAKVMAALPALFGKEQVLVFGGAPAASDTEPVQWIKFDGQHYTVVTRGVAGHYVNIEMVKIDTAAGAADVRATVSAPALVEALKALKPAAKAAGLDYPFAYVTMADGVVSLTVKARKGTELETIGETSIPASVMQLAGGTYEAAFNLEYMRRLAAYTEGDIELVTNYPRRPAYSRTAAPEAGPMAMLADGVYGLVMPMYRPNGG